MEIKILCNNTSDGSFYSEHGLSILINDEILFDTGQTDVYIKNARRLNIDLKRIKKVFISHGHYDHIGGLIFLQNFAQPEVYLHKKALVPKYSGERFAGIPYDWNNLKLKVNYLDKDISVDNIHLITNVPFNKEIIDKKFRLENGRDFFEDEINLVIDNFLFTGCAHRGIENIVEYTIRRYKIKYVIGGFHLKNVSEERINKVIGVFKKYNLTVFPLHCTGEVATQMIKKELKENCIILNAGDVWRGL